MKMISTVHIWFERMIRLIVFVCVSQVYLLTASAAEQIHYGEGSQIDAAVELVDVNGSSVRLLELFERAGKDINIVYFFGGGAMGNKQSAGGIWCSDSFEDLHILRSLVSRYSKQINFVSIAIPAVYHTKQLGFIDRALLDYPDDSNVYQDSLSAYVNSTQAAFNRGIIPVQPHFDPRFRLLMSDQSQKLLKNNYGTIPAWQGAFRAPSEVQQYGVPHLWILDANGKVLTEPFRGNIYHPHGFDVNINYTLEDVAFAIDDLLSTSMKAGIN